jgi:hypothetical protein
VNVEPDSFRVFEMGRMGPSLEVSLPRAWARRHDQVVVAFRNADPLLGWHAHILGENGAVLLSFPWTDHVDAILTGPEPRELPVELTEEGWDDLDQGWWGRAIVHGPDVYLAETDLDAITDVLGDRIQCQEPGIVLVDGVEVRWSCVSRVSYDAAWERAIEACRRGAPSPVGRWAEGRHHLVLVEG